MELDGTTAGDAYAASHRAFHSVRLRLRRGNANVAETCSEAAAATEALAAQLQGEAQELARAERNTWKLVGALAGFLREVQQDAMEGAGEEEGRRDTRGSWKKSVLRWLEGCAYADQELLPQDCRDALPGGTPPSAPVASSRFDPDGPQQGGDKTEDELQMLKSLWHAVRCGKVAEAQELCRTHKQWWRASTLAGDQLQFQGSFDYWREACDGVSENAAGATLAYERALYTALGSSFPGPYGEEGHADVLQDGGLWNNFLWLFVRAQVAGGGDSSALNGEHFRQELGKVRAAQGIGEPSDTQRAVDEIQQLQLELVLLEAPGADSFDAVVRRLQSMAQQAGAQADRARQRQQPRWPEPVYLQVLRVAMDTGLMLSSLELPSYTAQASSSVSRYAIAFAQWLSALPDVSGALGPHVLAGCARLYRADGSEQVQKTIEYLAHMGANVAVAARLAEGQPLDKQLMHTITSVRHKVVSKIVFPHGQSTGVLQPQGLQHPIRLLKWACGDGSEQPADSSAQAHTYRVEELKARFCGLQLCNRYWRRMMNEWADNNGSVDKFDSVIAQVVIKAQGRAAAGAIEAICIRSEGDGSGVASSSGCSGRELLRMISGDMEETFRQFAMQLDSPTNEYRERYHKISNQNEDHFREYHCWESFFDFQEGFHEASAAGFRNEDAAAASAELYKLLFIEGGWLNDDKHATNTERDAVRDEEARRVRESCVPYLCAQQLWLLLHLGQFDSALHLLVSVADPQRPFLLQAFTARRMRSLLTTLPTLALLNTSQLALDTVLIPDSDS